MRIKLYQNAAANYVARCYKGASPTCGMLHSPKWSAMLKKVEGQWLEVETDYLFADQFNTVPIPGVSEDGMRIMAADVEEIEDDIRAGRYLDRWTNKNYVKEEIPLECFEESRQQYLFKFVKNPNKYARGVILLEKPAFENGVLK